MTGSRPLCLIAVIFMAVKKRKEFIDDGRVIAPMNVEGMPWYAPEKAPRPVDGGAGGGFGGNIGSGDSAGIPARMSRRENAAFAFGVIKAALLVTFVFIGVLFLFILFCTNVWFR